MQSFCLSEYIEAALKIAVYEPEDDVIIAKVPDVDAFYISYGETYEEAKEMLADAIQGCVELAHGKRLGNTAHSRGGNENRNCRDSSRLADGK